ncbi:MAG TPA: extracellular solute-binding protein [Candidatus Limnocylindrales bacterium]|nr:extracellular solute-binding protein [Candidatus Limnocylindrales bacterium]
MMVRGRLAALGASALFVFAACSGSGAATTAPSTASEAPSAAASEAASEGSGEPVTITWYHIQNNDPGLSLWKDLADEYMAAHPNVKIDIQVNENEAFKTKLTTLLQQGDVPDLFQTWGGGGLRQQQEAGLVKDITADIAPWKSEINEGALGMYEVDGKNYGVPFDLGLVGFWYNTKAFEDAGITAPPTTWAEFLTTVKTLKDKGITPIALAGKDTWTGAFYWAYLAVRECGQAGMEKAVVSGDWSDPCFVKAGEDFKQLIDLEPFQEGFLAAPWDGAGSSAAAQATYNGAMQLMGQWLPGTVQANSGDKRAMGEGLGWFPFPGVDGGAGDPNDGLGGGNGFAVGKDAPPETVDFLHYLVSLDAANRWGALNSGILPTTNGSEASTTDPMLSQVLAGRAKAKFVQLYLDQATTPELGGAINEAVATLYAGTGTPQSVVEAIQAAAGGQ